MSSYVDLATLMAHLGASSDGAAQFTPEDELLLQLALDAATTMIDELTGRSFLAETGVAKYFYSPDGYCLGLTPDIRTVTSVAVDTTGDLTFATALAPADYYKWPLQSRPDAGIYSSLRIAPTSSKSFWAGRQVKVVGDWGYVVSGGAPASVQAACLLQAARLYTRRGSPLGIIQNTDIGTFRSLTKADDDVTSLLAPYRRDTWGLV